MRSVPAVGIASLTSSSISAEGSGVIRVSRSILWQNKVICGGYQRMDEQRIRELAAALLILAHWYETESGFIEPLDQVRAYLATFGIGQEVMRQDDENVLDSSFLRS
jgi:hypothetical protein